MHEIAEIDLLRLLAVFWRRKFMILLISLFVMVLGVMYARSLQPTYRAETKVLFEPSGSVLNAVSLKQSDTLDRVEAEIQMARSDGILQAIISDLDLWEDMRFKRRVRPLDRVKDRIMNRPMRSTMPMVTPQSVQRHVRQVINVRQVQSSSLLSFNAETRDPVLSAALSNSFAENYIAQQIESKVQSALDSLSIIKVAIDEAGENLEASQKELSDYLLQNADAIASATGNAKISSIADELEMAQKALDRLINDRDQLASLIERNQYELLVVRLSSSAVENLMSGAQVELLLDLLGRRQALLVQLERDEASTALNVQLANVEAEIRSLAKEGLDKLVEAAVQQQERRASLRNALQVEIFASDLSPEIASDIFKLQSNATSARNWYTNLVERADELEVQSQTQLADSRIVDRAAVPLNQSGPNRTRIVVIGLALGLFLASGLALLVDLFLGGIAGPRELENVVESGHIYNIPKVNLNRGKASVFKDPFGLFAECLRMVLIEIDAPASSPKSVPAQAEAGAEPPTAERKGIIVGITSSVAKEGKTVSSIGLSSVAALNGLKTCLVDFDFRRPSVSQYMGLSEESGLMGYLAGRRDKLKIQRMEFDEDTTIHLDVVSGRRTQSAFSFAAVQPSQIRVVLEELAATYDLIVVDLPPILAASETKSMAKQCDTILFCARQDFASKRVILEGYEALVSILPPAIKPIVAMSLSQTGRKAYLNGQRSVAS